MSTTDYPSFEKPLMEYVIASGDMRYIEINTREIFLRPSRSKGLILVGELTKGNNPSPINLCHMFLENAMSCEGCRDESVAFASLNDFLSKLSLHTVDRFNKYLSHGNQKAKIVTAFVTILNSMNVPYKRETSDDKILFQLEYDPIKHTAQLTGLSLWITMAQEALITFLENVLAGFSTEWEVNVPQDPYSDSEITQIELCLKPILY